MEKNMTSNGLIRVKDVTLPGGVSVAAAGFLLGCTALLGRSSPLPAALICGLNGMECAYALVGAAVGYIVSGGAAVSALYTCAMLITAVLRFIFGGRSSVFDTAVAAAAGICVCGAGFFAAGGLYDIFVSVVFGVVTAACSICSAHLRAEFINIKKRGLAGRSAAAAGILFLFICAALTSVQVSFLNLGAVVGAAVMLLLSDSRSACPIAAVLAAAGLTLGDREFAVSGMLLALAAAFVVMSNRYGRLFRSCVLIFSMAAGVAVVGADRFTCAAAASCVIPAVLYFALPEKLVSADRILSAAGGSRAFSAYADKLENMSGAVEDIRSSLEKTSEALKNESCVSIESVYEKASDRVCVSCPNSMTCWGSRYNDSAKTMNRALKTLKNGEMLSDGSFTGAIGRDCPSKKALADEMNRQYAAYCSVQSGISKVTEMRALLYSQLSATANMLRNMSEELRTDSEPAAECSSRVNEALRGMGFISPETNVFRRGGRLISESFARGTSDMPRGELMSRLSSAMGTEIEQPAVDECGGRVHITVTERTDFSVQTEVFRKSRNGKSQNGDSCDIFSDGTGNVYMILSDGMGSGSRARIDSAFVCGTLCRLIRSGIDVDTALELLNAAMLVKSHDESFATVDICRIDLRTGKVLLYKAGSAATYVKCGGNFARIECGSLPVGAAMSLDYSGKSFTLSDGDIIIMTSDGAVIENEWLARLLLRSGDPDLSKVMETIGQTLRLSSEKEHSDDITVMGLKLTR